MLSGKQKRYLRSLGNKMKSLVQIGKDGLNDNVIEALNVSLMAHELVKVNLLKTAPLSVNEVAIELAVATKSEIVQIIGKTILFYRVSKERKILLP